MMFQLRMKMLQKSSKKQFIVRIETRYHRSVNDIILESQRFSFVVSISIMIELKIRQMKQRMKAQKKKRERRTKQIENKRLQLIVDYNCTKSRCFNNKFQSENVEDQCVVHNNHHYVLTKEVINK